MKIFLSVIVFIFALNAGGQAPFAKEPVPTLSKNPAARLPAPACGPGWLLDGTAALYDRETLSDRIDGEAELFFPYGFETLSYGRYAGGQKSFDVDVYRLGSKLDAFGMYAGYKPEGADPLQVGNEGAVTASQLFFYQDRYFVRLQSTGEGDAGKAALAACAEALSRLLPKTVGAPKELEPLAIPEVDQESVRYSATSLLGYDFFARGLMADAVVAGAPARLFVFLAPSEAEAAKAYGSYQAQLQQAEVRKMSGGSSSLIGVDPLYGKAVAALAGKYVFGMVRLKDVAAALTVLDKLRLRLER